MIAEKQGWLFASRNFLLWQVPKWNYDCGFSMAYIEILLTDTVIIDYDGKKKVTKYDIDRTKEIWEKNNKKDEAPRWGNVKK